MKSPAETADEPVGAVTTTLRRPTPTELVTETWHVVQDLPVFLTAPLYRRWHLRWGATAAEATGLTALVLMEFGDFAMLRRMLRGIKARAEAGQLSLRLGTLA